MEVIDSRLKEARKGLHEFMKKEKQRSKLLKVSVINCVYYGSMEPVNGHGEREGCCKRESRFKSRNDMLSFL